MKKHDGKIAPGRMYMVVGVSAPAWLDSMARGGQGACDRGEQLLPAACMLRMATEQDETA